MTFGAYFGISGRFPDRISDTSTIFLYPSTTKELKTVAGAARSCKIDEADRVRVNRRDQLATF